MTPQEVRNIRLTSDYREMCNIRGPLISWQVIGGTPPQVDKYRLTINVRSIIAPGPTYRDQHIVDVTLPAGYPTAPPQVMMFSDPVVFHPNWWSHKHWCYGSWDFSEGLGHHIIRMIRTLQYDPIITNEDSAANRAANAWYLQHREEGLFPCDRQALPDPSKSKFEVQPVIRKKFEVQR
jgi:ubiquitin-protein ligase